MQEGEIELPHIQPVECRHAYWLYTEQAGILEVLVDAGDLVYHGEEIGQLTNVFGDHIHTYTAPEFGVILSKSVNPMSQAGGRIIYLGLPQKVGNGG